MIVEKRGESKVFEDVWMCLGDKLERRERELPRKTAQNFFVLKNEGYLYWKSDSSASGSPYRAVGHPADISSFGFFLVQFFMHI